MLQMMETSSTMIGYGGDAMYTMSNVELPAYIRDNIPSDGQ